MTTLETFLFVIGGPIPQVLIPTVHYWITDHFKLYGEANGPESD